MKHVLGIVFPHAELDGPRCVQLELQFLRLSYAVHRLAQSGVDACGYFVVLRQELRDTVLRLKADYQAGDDVRVVFASLLVSEMTALVDAAEVARKTGDEASAAGVRRAIAESVLRREVASQEPGVTETAAPDDMPFGVAWDFCGTVRSPAGGQDEAPPAGRPA